jgi:hypothetical protein
MEVTFLMQPSRDNDFDMRGVKLIPINHCLSFRRGKCMSNYEQFKNISFCGIFVAFLNLSMEAMLDSVLTGVETEVLHVKQSCNSTTLHPECPVMSHFLVR